MNDSPHHRAGFSTWERRGRRLMALLLVGFLPLAVYRAAGDLGGTDFPDYYAAGRFVLEHRQVLPGAMTAYYLPSVDVVWAAVALFPLPLAAALWYGLNSLAWLGLLRTIERRLLVEFEPDVRRHAALTAGLLMMPLVLDHLCLGAFHLIMLWLMAAGLARALSGEETSGGILLGLAVWIKLLPVVGVLYLILKRKWQPAAVAVLTAVAVDAVLTVGVFGPKLAWREHVVWFHHDAAKTAGGLLDDPAVVNEQRPSNQSLPSVLRRLLTRLGYPAGDARDLAAFADLSAGQLKMTYFAALGSLAFAIAWYCRRTANALAPWDKATEISLVTMSMLWVTPACPSYHPIAVTPALALLIGRRIYSHAAGAIMLFWIAAMLLHAVPLARALGHMLWATLALGLLLIVTRPRLPPTVQRCRAALMDEE